MSPLVGDTLDDIRRCWKPLALTDVVYKVVAFVLLTPLVAVLFRVLLAFSGGTVLADQDILYFFLGPVGWVSLIAVGGLWLAIVALELAALMAIVASGPGQQIGVLGALRFAAIHAWPVLQVTVRLVLKTVLAAAPFLVVGAVVYFTLLTEFDINYYLQHKPPAFLTALGIGAILALGLAVVLLRLFTGWFFALAILLFEDVESSQVLRMSRDRAAGDRRTIMLALVGWFVATSLLSALATGAVVGLGRFLVPRATGSLGLLTFVLGTSLLLWAAVGLFVNLLSTTSFAAMLFNLYRKLGSEGPIDPARLDVAESAASGCRYRLTTPRLIAAGLLGVVGAAVIGAFAMLSVRLDDDVAIIAHRGSSKAAPENTLASVRQAIDDGTEWVEIDVQETADGEVVVFHDSDFMKLAGVDLKIWDATLDDLNEIDIGSWFGGEFKDQRVSTLGNVLDVCRDKVGVVIELKYYGHDQQLEQRVAKIVEAHDMVDRVMLMSLKLDAVQKMKSLRPEWKVGLLMSVTAGDLQKIEADFLAINAGFANRRMIRNAHNIGKDVYVWTVNDAVGMSAMIGRGVDGLITDKPALARSVLRQRAEMSPPERLLVELAEVFGVAAEPGEQ